MKKIVSLLLCILLAAAMLVPAIAADAQNEDFNNYPVVIVPGYSSTQLHLVQEDGSWKSVWWLDYSKILDKVNEEKWEILYDLAQYKQGNKQRMIDHLTLIMDEIAGVLACNPDGSSKYAVEPDLPLTAEGSRWSSVRDNDRRLMGYIDEIYDTDNIYMCTCDFRLGALYNAGRLNTLIENIIETTGAEKVNILCQSHGGQITATYLAEYHDNAVQHVNSAVLCVPAIAGAALAYDTLTEQIQLDEQKILEFVEYNQKINTDLHWLIASDPFDVLDDLIKNLMPVVKSIIGNWQSLWDFLPMDKLDEAKQFVQPGQEALWDATIYYHEHTMKHIGESLRKVQADGVNVTIIAGSGIASVTGMQINSDGIITLNGATGATAAPYGQRFNDGYTCVGTVCSNASHNHLSPSMEVDASTCYLPENTWIIDGYFHGQERMDDMTIALVRRQLLSVNPLKDVHEDPAFPQFHQTASISSGLFAKFNNSPEGHLSSADTALLVTNPTSAPIYLADISAKGVDLEFNNLFGKIIPAGKTVSIKFTGEIPAVSLTRAALSFSFSTIGKSATPIAERTMDFTIMNGPAVAYDASTPYVNADFDLLIPDDANLELLNKFGLGKIFEAFVKFLNRILTIAQKLFGTIGSIADLIP